MATIGRVIGANFWVQWNGVDYVDESANLIAAQGQVRFNAVGAGALSGRSTTDQMTVTLHNASGRYSPLNTSSPIYSALSGGGSYLRKCYLEVSIGGSYYSVFKGVIKIPRETGKAFGALSTVTIDCRSLDELYLTRKASTGRGTFLALQNLTEADAITQWLSNAGVAGGDLAIDDGLVTIPWVWLDDESIIEDVWALAACAGGRFYVDPDGTFRYENAQHWLFSPHTVSQQTYTRADYKRLYAYYDDADLYSDVTVEVSARRVEGIDNLWTPEEDVVIPAGTTKTITAQFRYPAYTIDDVTFAAQTAGGVDLSDDVTLSDATYYAQRADLEFTNDSDYSAYLIDLAVTGRAIVGGPRQDVKAAQADSFWTNRAARNRRISSNLYVQTMAHGKMLAEMIRDVVDSPRMVYRMENVLGNPQRRLGDRITINDDAVMSSSRAAFVTGIQFTFNQTGFLQTIEAMDAASLFPYSDYLVIGTDVLGTEKAFY